MSDAAHRSSGSVRAFLGRRFRKIREINRRYAGHHVRMTPMVSAALFLLRLYLILLVGILFLKFFMVLSGR